MKHCKTCTHWTPYAAKYPAGDASDDERAGGFCESAKLTEDWGDNRDADMLVYPYCDGGTFWTGPEFGCVHHQSHRPRSR